MQTAPVGNDNPRSTAAKDAHARSRASGSLIDWSAARHVKAQAEDVQIGQIKRVQTDFLSEMSRVTSPLVEAVNKLTTTLTAAADEDGDDGLVDRPEQARAVLDEAVDAHEDQVREGVDVAAGTPPADFDQV